MRLPVRPAQARSEMRKGLEPVIILASSQRFIMAGCYNNYSIPKSLAALP
jgi:hypothetical protein